MGDGSRGCWSYFSRIPAAGNARFFQRCNWILGAGRDAFVGRAWLKVRLRYAGGHAFFGFLPLQNL